MWSDLQSASLLLYFVHNHVTTHTYTHKVPVNLISNKRHA